ncbi:hypothetical protein M3Y96_00272900 [Aphelenchoides besseyi]|nr:hypothetical protein M3Y96_00272900 [Aphelenchoides besseyi]
MQQNLSSNGNGHNEHAFYEVMTLPMPSKNDELFEQMDIWTAASLDGLRPDANPQLQLTSKELSCANHAGWTPLMYAAYLGHLNSTRYFLGLNADLEQQNALGQTALMLAASCGNEDMLKLLLEHTKSKNAKDKMGQTALHYASLYGQGRLANLLLQFGYDPNAEDNEKMTPTLIACASGQLDVLSQMLKNNGDPDHKNCRAENGEQIAIANKQRHVVDQLHKHRKVVEKHRETADLKTKFKSNDLEKYWDIFVQNNFTTFAAFSKLTSQDLDDMEIKLLGPRKKLQGMILAIKQQISAQPTTSTANRHLRPDSAIAENVRLNQRAPSPSAAPPIPNRDGTPIDYRRLYHDSNAKLEAYERKIEVMKVLLAEQSQLNSTMCQHLKSFAKQPPSIAADEMLRSTLNQVVSRRFQNSYHPGCGIRRIDDVLKQKNGTAVEDDGPITFKTHTIFGTKREDPFYYSDRKSGKGYSNYRQEPYWHRKFIYPPIRKHFRNILIICSIGLFCMMINWEWVFFYGEELQRWLGFSFTNKKPKF